MRYLRLAILVAVAIAVATPIKLYVTDPILDWMARGPVEGDPTCARSNPKRCVPTERTHIDDLLDKYAPRPNGQQAIRP